jgi:hypothetical protein
LKRRAPLEELDRNTSAKKPNQPTTTKAPLGAIADASNNPSPMPPNKEDIGRASKMLWYNKLTDDKRLRGVLDHLAGKIRKMETMPNGCIQVVGFTKGARPVADRSFQEVFAPSALTMDQNASAPTSSPWPSVAHRARPSAPTTRTSSGQSKTLLVCSRRQ